MAKAEYFDSNEDIIILGVALRTSPVTAAKDIPAFWQQFMQEGGVSRIPGQKDDLSTYAVYCDYESDFRGAYTMVLGIAVKPQTEVPVGMRRVRIPKGNYARFCAKGDPTQVIWQTWEHVNAHWDKRAERRYIADFERYAPDAMAGGTMQAEIVVGLT